MSLETILRTLLPRTLADRLLASPIGMRITRGAFWTMLGSTAARGLLMLSSIAVARLLGRDAYGEYGIVRTTFAMFQIFALFGIEVTATKYVAEFRRTAPDRAGRIIALSTGTAALTGGLIAALLFGFAPWLSAHQLAAPQLTTPLRIGALLLLLTALNGSQLGILSGLEAFRATARVQIIAGLATVPLVVGGAWLGDVDGAVWGLTASMGLTWALTGLATRRACAEHGLAARWRDALVEWRILFNYSLPLLLGSAVVAPVNWLTQAMLVNQPGGYGQMGLYNAAMQWRALVLLVPSYLSRAILPILSNLHGEGQIKAFKRTLWINFVVSAAVAAAIALVVIAAAGWIMAAYGGEFRTGIAVLRIVALTAVLMQLAGYMGLFIRAVAAVWWGFAVNAVWAVVTIVLTQQWVVDGATGLAWAYLTAYGASTLFSAVYMGVRIRAMSAAAGDQRR